MNHPLLGEFGASAIPIINKSGANYQAGLKIMGALHNASTKYSAYPYKTLDELLAHYANKADILVNGLGRSFILSEKPDDYYITMMTDLADQGKGRIPSWQSVTDALTGNLVKSTVWEDAKIVAQATTETVSNIATAVKDTTVGALSAASNVIKVLPYIAVGVGVLFLYMKFRKK
jgi:hypothetical protein